MYKYQEEYKKIYEERLLNQNTKLSHNDIQLLYLLKFLPKNKKIKILDAGCGNGKYANYLVENGYKNVFAVDLFSDIKNENISYETASIDNLPFYDNYFDFIYSNSVIYYLNRPEKGIKEFNRCLKKEGILIFTAHTKYSLFTLWRIIKRDFFKFKKMTHLKGVKFYSANTYKKKLLDNGFDIVLVDGYLLSFFIYTGYFKFVKMIYKLTGIKLPLLSPKVTKYKWLAKLKSIFAYHSIIVAKKVS